MIYHSSKVLNS